MQIIITQIVFRSIIWPGIATMNIVTLQDLTEIYCICRYKIANPQGTGMEIQV